MFAESLAFLDFKYPEKVIHLTFSCTCDLYKVLEANSYIMTSMVTTKICSILKKKTDLCKCYHFYFINIVYSLFGANNISVLYFMYLRTSWNGETLLL